MDSEKFKNIADGCKNITLLLAIIIGGFWTLYVFNSKLEVSNAKAQLKKLEYELERFAIVTAEIDSTYEKVDSGFILVVTVRMKNHGQDAVKVLFEQKILTIAKPKFREGKIVSYDDVIYTELYSPSTNIKGRRARGSALVLFPGQEKTSQFLAYISMPGFYQITFAGKPDKSLINKRKEIGMTAKNQVISAFGFINVK